jgi:hypothetical protein
VAVTSTRSGELDSGIHSPAETTCSNILVSNGLPAITTGSSEQAASVCDQMFFFAQAADHAGLNPTRPSLVEGLSQMGYFNSAYTGDSNWNRPGKIEGGDFQRAIRYHVSCQCWQVVDRSFGPGY